MVYISGRPHWVPTLSSKNRKLRLKILDECCHLRWHKAQIIPNLKLALYSNGLQCNQILSHLWDEVEWQITIMHVQPKNLHQLWHAIILTKTFEYLVKDTNISERSECKSKSNPVVARCS